MFLSNTFYDVLQVSTKPEIASLSSCFVYSAVPRNMKDDMFRSLAKNGAVVGLNLGDSFLNQKDAEGLKQRIAHRNELEPGLNGEARSLVIPQQSLQRV